MRAEGENDSTGLMPWDASRSVTSVSPLEARLSRGFLRCKPEKWFPGLAAQWVPLFQNLDIDLRVAEVVPLLEFPLLGLSSFCATIDDEPFIIAFEEYSRDILIDAIASVSTPSTSFVARNLTLEYLARRVVATLASSWSGIDRSIVKFEPEIDPKHCTPIAAIKIVVQINGRECNIWVSLGKFMVDRLDGLWRRQLKAGNRQPEKNLLIQVELAQLAVSHQLLGDYVRSGAVIDLEVMASSDVTLRLGRGINARPWAPAKLIEVGGRVGFQVLAGSALNPPLPDGATRVSIVIAEVELEAPALAEIAQAGAMLDTDSTYGAPVSVVVNSEKVAEAALCTYEGRFAISVL